jgi:hypothetical protein
MVSSICLSGRLGKAIGKNMRIVEIDEVAPGEGGHYEVHEIPVRFQAYENSPIMKEENGSLIIVKGRLGTDPEIGLIVISEIDELYRLPKGVERI